MKLLVILSVLALSVYMCAGFSAEICKWTSSRDALIKKLTPDGQNAVKTILESLQRISCAAVQPLYEHLGQKFAKEIKTINASSDASKLAQFGALLGVGNYSCGAGPLHDDCQDAKAIETLVASFAPANKGVLEKILKDVGTHMRDGIKPVLAINYVLNQDLYNKLGQTEDKATLAALNKLYGN